VEGTDAGVILALLLICAALIAYVMLVYPWLATRARKRIDKEKEISWRVPSK
jgi:hypothetical protein